MDKKLKNTFSRRFKSKVTDLLDRANIRYKRYKNTKKTNILQSNIIDEYFSLKKNSKILYVGLGNGSEYYSILRRYEGHEIYGVDISNKSIKLTQQLVPKCRESILIYCDAVNLCFPDNHFDLIFLNSLLHEVYSYNPNSYASWKKAILESIRVANKSGLIYIEDFAGSEKIGTSVKIKFNTDISMKFYNYFRQEYCTFNRFKIKKNTTLIKIRNDFYQNMPKVDRKESFVTLDNAVANEFLVHFKIFLNDYERGEVDLYDEKWIEINERYFITTGINKNVFSPIKYSEEICKIGKLHGYKLGIKKIIYEDRPGFLETYNQHFVINNEKNQDVSSEFGKKMTLILEKR